MTPLSQTIAICVLAGWSQIHNTSTMLIDGQWVGYPPKNPIPGKPVPLPDMLNDLNAIREAVVGFVHYPDTLDFVNHVRDITHRDATLYVIPSAAQLCEAFLKTYRLWVRE